jgi:NhaP-type Na+/H+ or K+/H+ antiporter
MIEFLFGLLLGYVFGYGVFTITDKIDRQLKDQNERE